MDAPPRRPTPGDADALFESYFDGEAIRFTESTRSGVDEQRARALAIRTLEDAMTPGNPSGWPAPLDLDERWHVVHVTVRADSPGLAGGALGASRVYLRSVRDLIESLIAHLSR